MKRLQRARPWVQIAVAILSFGVSLLVFWFLWGSLPFALIIMISVALHELCHLLAYRYYGMKSGIVFLLILAATYFTNIEKKDFRWDKLDKAVWVFSAGLIGNCALGLILLGLRGVAYRWFIEPVEWYLLFAALTNFYLALLNLAPILGMTDGEKIIKTIMYCFSEEREKAAILFLTLAELIGVAGTWALTEMGRIAPFVGMFVQIFFVADIISNIVRLSRWPPRPIPGGLSKDEAMKHALIYFGLVVLTLFGLWLLPISEIITLLWG